MFSFPVWEQLMIYIAEERGWEFSFDGETVPNETVFNAATYGPVILAAAAEELRLRQIGGELAITLHGDPASLFGARVEFDPARNTVTGQVWRLHTAIAMVESLPRKGNVLQLDPLPAVLPDTFRRFIEPELD